MASSSNLMKLKILSQRRSGADWSLASRLQNLSQSWVLRICISARVVYINAPDHVYKKYMYSVVFVRNNILSRLHISYSEKLYFRNIVILGGGGYHFKISVLTPGPGEIM
jgi:hypothetical protein